MNITVLGNGSWGTAMSLILKQKHRVILTGVIKDELDEIRRTGENKKYLPGYGLTGIEIEPDYGYALAEADCIVTAIPTAYLRETVKKAAPFVKRASSVVSLTKGFEETTYKLPTEIIEEYFGAQTSVLALSGPSHAEEAAAGIPTAVTLASRDFEAVEKLCGAFMTDRFRVYMNRDVRGVQLGGAVKNIIALAAGISDGMGYGANTLSALMTRGLVEIGRFAVALGASADTLYGLAGIGDLITTCTSTLSRNHYVGEQLGKGHSLEEIRQNMVMVAEGVYTVTSVYKYAREKKIEMPITEAVYRVLFEGLKPQEALKGLMTRHAKEESASFF